MGWMGLGGTRKNKGKDGSREAWIGLIVGRGGSQLDGCTVLSMTPIVTAKYPLEGEAPPPTSPTSICELVFP